MAAETAKRTMTMSWDGLLPHDDDADDSDDLFFESHNRISSAQASLLDYSSSDDDDDDDFDDSRLSFASAVSSASAFIRPKNQEPPQPQPLPPPPSPSPSPQPPPDNYDVWMGVPGSIKDRRKRLLQGMGLNSTKDLFRLTTMRLASKKFSKPKSPTDHHDNDHDRPKKFQLPPPVPPPRIPATVPAPETETTPPKPALYRSRSDGDMEWDSFYTKSRREEIIGSTASKQRLMRTASTIAPCYKMCRMNVERTRLPREDGENEEDVEETRKGEVNIVPSSSGGNQLTAFFLIKNLDTGKEFVVKEFDQHGMWNRLRDLQTGKQMTMEEFEKTVGHSPVVQELMRRQIGHGGHGDGDRKLTSLSKRFRYSKKRGVSFLKNIKSSVTSGKYAEKEIDAMVQQHQKGGPTLTASPSRSKNPSSDWIKVRQLGKTMKELTAMRFCQEIPAHEGSIWTMKFNFDGKYLATAGVDRVIHVWEVQECEIASSKPAEDGLCPSPDRNHHAPDFTDFTSGPLDKKKKWKLASKKNGMIPDYVQLPDSVFSLSEKPFCTLTGHQDDVLDLCWARSAFQLLSSSMDKTVRLWDLETQTCQRLFAHNDYVTCIQFNPVDDNYFISGSLDFKLRIWNVPGCRVVHWDDLHEMVTAACFSPDGQTAVVGSHKGTCRIYSTADGKLTQINQFDLPKKKKNIAKITGFEFNNSSEVLITSADSRIRIYNGTELVHKFMGFRNTSSQIAASFSPCGKHVICASEDSNVYVWKREDHTHHNINNTNSGTSNYVAKGGKTYISCKSYENFPCKEVSVAIPWPGSAKLEPPTIPLHHHHKKGSSKRHSSHPMSVSGSPTKSESGSTIKKHHHLPPLPRRGRRNSGSGVVVAVTVEQENEGGSLEEGPKIARTESTSGDNTSSYGGSVREGDSPSMMSVGGSGTWNWVEGGGSGEGMMQATGWGMVVVTAGQGGEIRAYQNFGLPVRVGRR